MADSQSLFYNAYRTGISSLDRSVAVVTRLRAWRLRKCSICDSSRYTLDTGGVKWPGRESDHSRHLAPKLRINSATLSLPNMYSWRGQGQIHFIYLLQTEVYEYYKRGGYEGTIIVSLSCDERRRRRRGRKQRAVHAQKFLKFIKISFQPLLSGFGGLEVACWPLVPKYPLDFSGRKKNSSARLPSEGK